MIQSVDGKTPDKPVSAYVHPTAVVTGDVKLAPGSSVWPCAVIRGDLRPVEIGESTNVQDGCALHTGKFKLKVGSHVALGHHVVLHSCEIGDGTMIGIGSIVLDGAKVGKNCLVAAGSLVLGGMEIPDGSFVAGSPARILRDTTPEEVERTAEICARYEALAKTYIRTGIIR